MYTRARTEEEELERAIALSLGRIPDAQEDDDADLKLALEMSLADAVSAVPDFSTRASSSNKPPRF